MTTFLLIRHGHTDWIGKALAGHTPGVSLSECGRRQAEQLANRLQPHPIAAIYSSPLQRTLETAEAIARALGLQVMTREGLIEVDFGEWTGRSMCELEADSRWKLFNTFRSSVRAPGGDMMIDVQSRMLDELEHLRLQHPDQTVAIVSHQDSIKAVLAHYAGISLDLFHRLEVSPASVSVLALAEWGPRILSVNSTGKY